MRKVAIGVLGVILLSMFAIPQFTAAPGGINSFGDNGCSCHGGPSSDGAKHNHARHWFHSCHRRRH
mgnify:CR=1 FL=1